MIRDWLTRRKLLRLIRSNGPLNWSLLDRVLATSTVVDDGIWGFGPRPTLEYRGLVWALDSDPDAANALRLRLDSRYPMLAAWALFGLDLVNSPLLDELPDSIGQRGEVVCWKPSLGAPRKGTLGDYAGEVSSSHQSRNSEEFVKAKAAFLGKQRRD